MSLKISKFALIFFLLIFNSLQIFSMNIFDSYYSFLGKEIIIEFKEENDLFLTNKREICFLLLTDFNEIEVELWREHILTDKYFKEMKIIKSNEKKGWEIHIELVTELNRNIAKPLFTYSIKADYIFYNDEKMPFNVLCLNIFQINYVFKIINYINIYTYKTEFPFTR